MPYTNFEDPRFLVVEFNDYTRCDRLMAVTLALQRVNYNNRASREMALTILDGLEVVRIGANSRAPERPFVELTNGYMVEPLMRIRNALTWTEASEHDEGGKKFDAAKLASQKAVEVIREAIVRNTAPDAFAKGIWTRETFEAHHGMVWEVVVV